MGCQLQNQADDATGTGFRLTCSVIKRRITSWLEPPASTGELKASADASDWGSLLRIPDDEEFVREAYRRILRRECDIAGFLHYRELLRSHVPRKAILRALATSDEARRLGWRLKGTSRFDVRAVVARWRGRQIIAGLLRGLLGWAGRLYESLLLRPLRLVEAKTDYLLHEVQARNEQLSVKLDSYVAELQGQQAVAAQRVDSLSLRIAELKAQLATTTTSLEKSITAAVAAIGRSTREDFVGLSRSLEQLDRRLRTIEGSVAAAPPALQSIGEDLVLVREGYTDLRKILEELASAQAKLGLGQSKLITAIEEGFKGSVFSAGQRLLVTMTNGLIMGVPQSEWRVAAHLAFRGPLEPGVSRLFCKLVRPGMTVVDVGAHIGWYTLLAGRLLGGMGKVYSFEPAPDTFELLCANVQVNGILETGVIKLLPLAVSDRCGRSVFGLCAGDSGHNSLFPEPTWETIAVGTTSLDEALKHEARVDVVKIDAEGAEPLIFRGMREILDRSPEIRILMEFAPQHLQRAGILPRAFLEEILGQGLKIFRIDDSTGELFPPACDDLTNAFTAMLLLVRSTSGVEGR